MRRSWRSGCSKCSTYYQVWTAAAGLLQVLIDSTSTDRPAAQHMQQPSLVRWSWRPQSPPSAAVVRRGPAFELFRTAVCLLLFCRAPTDLADRLVKADPKRVAALASNVSLIAARLLRLREIFPKVGEQLRRSCPLAVAVLNAVRLPCRSCAGAESKTLPHAVPACSKAHALRSLSGLQS